VARRTGVTLIPLGHEGDGVSLLPGDLLGGVLVDRVAVGHLQRVGVTQPDLLLARPPLALRRLDGNAGALHMRANGADEVLFFRPLQDVVILDDASNRRRIDEALLRHRLVGILEDVQLQFRRRHRGEAHVRGAGDLAAQHAARRHRHHLVLVLLVDVAEHKRRLRQPRGHPQRFEIGDGPEIAVAFRPRGEGVAGDGIHLHVAGQQVIAGVHPVRDHLVDEEPADEALADQAPVHVGKRRDDGVDLIVGDEAFEGVDVDASLHDAVARSRGCGVSGL